MNSRVIYKKRYPRVDYSAIGRSASHLDVTPGESKQTFEEFYQKILDSETLIPIPERQNKWKRFVTIAVDVSKIYDLDTVITRYDSLVSVNYSFDGGSRMKYLKPVLALADDYSFYTGVNDRDITISLDYYTHSVCRNGKVIMP